MLYLDLIPTEIYFKVRGHLAAKLDPLNIKTSFGSARDIVYGRYLGEAGRNRILFNFLHLFMR